MIYIKRWIEHYEELFPIEENQVEYFKNLCGEFNAPAKFLSAECGPALLCQELNKNNIDVTVTDTFSEFISKVKKSQETFEQKIHAFNIYPSDISRYLGKNFYNVIYCGNYRLIFLKDRALIRKLILDAKLLLTEGGYLVFDLINFSKMDFSQPRIDLPVKKSGNLNLYSHILKNSESMKYYLNQQVVTNEGISIDEVKDEEICPISLESFKAYSAELGFSSVQFYSDYKGTPLSEDSEKIICVLKK